MNTVKIELTDEQIKQLKPLIDEAQRLARNDETFAVIGQVMLYGGLTYLDLVELWANVFSGDEFGVINKMIVDGKSKVKELTENIEVLAETLSMDNLAMLQQESEIARLRALLESVEWINNQCPWCSGICPMDQEDGNDFWYVPREERGHKPDCEWRLALGLEADDENRYALHTDG